MSLVANGAVLTSHVGRLLSSSLPQASQRALAGSVIAVPRELGVLRLLSGELGKRDDMNTGDSTQADRDAWRSLVRGALIGLVVAFGCVLVANLLEPAETGGVEALVAFTILPLVGALVAHLAWRHEWRAAEATQQTPRQLEPDNSSSGRIRRRLLVGVGHVTVVALLTAGGGVLSQVLPAGPSRVDRTGASATTDVQGVPGRPDVRLAVAGDTGTGTPHQWRTGRTMFLQSQTRSYDALVLLGDLIYPSGDAGLVRRVVTGPFSSVLAGGTELVPVLGNHDYEQGEQQQILDALDRRSPWYVEQVGSVRLIALDSVRVEDNAQTQWLQGVLATPQPAGTWTVVAMHHPAYSAGAHGSEIEVRQAWGDLFARYDVPLVLAGHEHDYQRSTPQDGVTYVVSGAGAKVRAVGVEEFTAASSATLHYLDLLVYDDRLVGRAIDQSGEIIDEFTIDHPRA